MGETSNGQEDAEKGHATPSSSSLLSIENTAEPSTSTGNNNKFGDHNLTVSQNKVSNNKRQNSYNNDDENDNNNDNNIDKKITMGNEQSSTSSCASGFESVKDDILTVVNSEETQELQDDQNLDDPAVMSGDFNDENEETNSNGNNNDSDIIISTTTDESEQQPKGLFIKRWAQRGHRAIDRVSHVAGNALQALGGAVFPHAPHVGGSALPTSFETDGDDNVGGVRRHKHPQTVIPRVRGGVLMHDCLSDDEHREKVRQILQLIRPMHGKEGLTAIGLEYRLIHCHRHNTEEDNENNAEIDNGPSENKICLSDRSSSSTTTPSAESATHEFSDQESLDSSIDGECHKCATRLFHIESNTMITDKNRKLYIADGDMYDAVARLCQEYAQDIMIKEAGLEWVTICEAGNNPEPIRALVSKDISVDETAMDKNPTMLIATGKGKVRAGIFSRQHLLISGMECSTALPIVRQAVLRNMYVIMVDPNVHGDRMGMITFEKTMSKLFRRWETPPMDNNTQEHVNGNGGENNNDKGYNNDDCLTCNSAEPPLGSRDLYILSHSQSGAQLARYLLDKSQHYVPHIRAVAFTDSTHNIQWARENEDLHSLLQSPKSVYFRCARDKTDDALVPTETVGKQVETDSFWEHRFGTIQTFCAGTSEHSLTNWFALDHIWDHFDNYLKRN